MQAKDHPRTCGEKHIFQHSIGEVVGSPPHMRGKVCDAHAYTDGSWITPAHAGKSGWDDVIKEESRDHPRTCGEKLTVKEVHQE